MRYTPLIVLLCGLPLRADDLGLKAPSGFKVTVWADHTLANDIYTMCLDEKGRVVVSGPGYIRRLEDTNGDGKADKATDIAAPKLGMMGLCFSKATNLPDGAYRLTTSGNGELRSETFHDDEKRATSWIVIRRDWLASEHGGHSVKIGPDGFEYAIAGNSTKLDDAQFSRSTSRGAEAGGMIRFRSSDFQSPQFIAHGFRNPYDFDFTSYGDIITYDSDSERDAGLPWYTPTRVYHVMPGAHHGWRLPGGMRSLARRDYYPDTVPMLADMGRGSPTGVCCYRHFQFPEHYRGGVFLLDWTFGRVHYMPLIPEGSSYKPVKPELFLESTGTNGFAPTAARVAPDGSLFISIGGRGTRGAVYRVEYQIDGKPVPPRPEPKNDIDKVLDAPQPLEAWSMAKWMPLADKLLVTEFVPIILSDAEPVERRIRAIEIIAPRRIRWSQQEITQLIKSSPVVVRSRLAWALGINHGHNGFGLRELANDRNPRVVVEAIAKIGEYIAAAKNPRITLGEATDGISIERITEWTAHADVRVRHAAARFVSQLPDGAYGELERTIRAEGNTRSIVTLLSSELDHRPRSRISTESLLPLAMKAQGRATSIDERLDALRAVMLALGDWNVDKPTVEVLAGYSLRTATNKPGYQRMMAREVANSLRADFPSTSERFNLEASRLFAMLEVDDPSLIRKVMSQITETSHPTRDFHYLTVLARMGALRDETHAAVIAEALLRLPKKLADQKVRVESNWSLRFAELVGELIRTQPKLDEFLAVHPDLVQPDNVVVATKLPGTHRRGAAKRFLAVARENAEIPLSADLIRLLAVLPAADVSPVLRARWSDRSVRDAIVVSLATNPDPRDRDKFLEMLERDGETAKACLDALKALPRDPSAANLVPLIARLRQAFAEPKESALRSQILELINRNTGKEFVIGVDKMDMASLAAAYRPVFDWFAKAHPEESKRLNVSNEDESNIRKMLPSVKWETGDVERGRKLFNDRGCQACHGGNARLGPELVGVGKRLSRDDLLTSIVNPSRDVSPAYRVTHVDTKDGKRVSGVIVYDSNEMLLVQTAATETKRISGADVEGRLPSAKSLMPDGLLKGLEPEDLADLFSFLGTQ